MIPVSGINTQVDASAMRTRNAGGSGLGMVKRTIQGVVLAGRQGWRVGAGGRSWKQSIFLLIKIIYIHIIKTKKYQRTYDEQLVS